MSAGYYLAGGWDTPDCGFGHLNNIEIGKQEDKIWRNHIKKRTSLLFFSQFFFGVKGYWLEAELSLLADSAIVATWKFVSYEIKNNLTVSKNGQFNCFFHSLCCPLGCQRGGKQWTIIILPSQCHHRWNQAAPSIKGHCIIVILFCYAGCEHVFVFSCLIMHKWYWTGHNMLICEQHCSGICNTKNYQSRILTS